MTKKIDAKFVDEWSARYLPKWDAEVLEDVHPRVNSQGYYTLDDAKTVIRWKSRRSGGYLKRNDPADIKAITKMALDGPEHLAHRVLGVLRGVGNPVASALLMVAKPDTFTVMDRYAVHSLRQHCEWTAKGWPSYPDYVKLCDAVAHRCNRSLRELDRALWAWGEHNRP